MFGWSKSLFKFSVRWYKKAQINFLANLIYNTYVCVCVCVCVCVYPFSDSFPFRLLQDSQIIID